MEETIEIIQGVTPTLTLDIEDANFGLATHVYFTIKQNGAKLRLSETDGVTIVDSDTLEVYLTQEQSLMFEAKEAAVQVNVTYSDGSRGASEIGYIVFDENLETEVLA